MITGNPSKRYGWNNNSLTKKRMVGVLQSAIRERTLDITDELIIEEGKHLIYKSGNRTAGANVQAAKKGQRRTPGSLGIGFYDDSIFALGGALLLESVLDPPKTPKQNALQEKIELHQRRLDEASEEFDDNAWLKWV